MFQFNLDPFDQFWNGEDTEKRLERTNEIDQIEDVVDIGKIVVEIRQYQGTENSYKRGRKPNENVQRREGE